jgi:hypothetical protein
MPEELDMSHLHQALSKAVHVKSQKANKSKC